MKKKWMEKQDCWASEKSGKFQSLIVLNQELNIIHKLNEIVRHHSLPSYSHPFKLYASETFNSSQALYPVVVPSLMMRMRCGAMMWWWQDLVGRKGYTWCIMCTFIAYLFTLKYSFNRIRLFTVENQIIFLFATSSSLHRSRYCHPSILRFASPEFRWRFVFRLCCDGVWSSQGAVDLIIYALAQCDNGNVEQT